MKPLRTLPALFSAVAALTVIGCGDTTATVPGLYNDSTATLDIAATSGDAMSLTVETMAANEAAAGFSADIVSSSALLATAPANALAIVRTRTCRDANGAVVANCSPIASVRQIITHVTEDGSRSSTTLTTGGTSATWIGAVHRVSNDSATRHFNTATPAIETGRSHTDLTVSHDTTLFTEGTISRATAEVAHDSVKAVTFSVPKSSQYPVSGSIVRVDSVHIAITKATQTQTKDVVRTVEIDFPADAQGNIVMKINGKTCKLNLVTHVVSACH
jgi:hypothetical protein